MVTLEDLYLAQRRLAGVALRTPLVRCVCSEARRCPCSGTGRILRLKLESLQPVGAFKLRGAYNKMCSLSDEQRATGVVAYSSGNHAQGVAYAARDLGVRATIVLPEDVSKVKLARTQSLGAEIVLAGTSGQERRAEAERLARDNRYEIVVPYDDETLIAGQGTVGLEILEDMPDVQTVLVPVGGGGLISGIAAAMKLQRPRDPRDRDRAGVGRRCPGKPAQGSVGLFSGGADRPHHRRRPADPAARRSAVGARR